MIAQSSIFANSVMFFVIRELSHITLVFSTQGKAVTVNIKRLSYLSPSSGISIVWRADSWRRRHTPPHLSALQTMEMPLDGANTADS